MTHIFPAPPVNVIPVLGAVSTYAVRRIFCVGRNYAAHAAEMGNEVDREAPWYFTKTPHDICASGATIPFPPGTTNLHHEIELVVALGSALFRADPARALAAVFAYGCGLDMTRRDLQQVGKDNRRPWDLGKDFENAAVISPLTPAARLADLSAARIHLSVNGVLRQDAVLSDMVWSVAEILSHLSGYYHLGPGDIIMTGTPAGVGAVEPGDVLTGGIDGLAPVKLTIGPPET